MNYEKHYQLLIERAKNRILDLYFEKHHIIPKCIGGTNVGKSKNLGEKLCKPKYNHLLKKYNILEIKKHYEIS